MRSFAEDVGDGDHTSLSCIPENATGSAHLLVKDNGIIAGVELAILILKQVDKSIKVKQYIADGAVVKPGDIAFIASGKEQAILKAERLLLNCMQRMSGIATRTHQLVSLCQGTGVKLLDTRKTSPGLRMLEKWAVKIGGGENHRYGLYDMILLKDNHVDYAGGIKQAITAANKYIRSKNKKLKIEIEVRNFNELEEALAIGNINRILLDNFTPATLKKAIKLINNCYETEASGGITEKNIRSYAETGVNYISMGALTHSIKSLDMSLKAIK